MEDRWVASVKPHSIAKDDVKVRLVPDRQWRSAGAVASEQDKFEMPVWQGRGDQTRPDRGNSICNVFPDYLEVTVSVAAQLMPLSGCANQGVGLLVSEGRRQQSTTGGLRIGGARACRRRQLLSFARCTCLHYGRQIDQDLHALVVPRAKGSAAVGVNQTFSTP
jgi:hypothetical protein